MKKRIIALISFLCYIICWAQAADEHYYFKNLSIYNPQNEMFRLLGTKRSFSQNETFFFSHPYPALFRLISHF